MLNGKQYYVYIDVIVHFSVGHGSVDLEFCDRQYDIEGEYEALDERDAIEQAEMKYIQHLTEFMGESFVNFVTIDFSNQIAEEIEDES